MKKLKPLPVEAIVRHGYLIGSGWKTTRRPVVSAVSDCHRPALNGRPSAATDLHTFDQGGGRRPRRISTSSAPWRCSDRTSRPRYATPHCASTASAAYALERGIIIADTKFEFWRRCRWQAAPDRRDTDPDSSRFWPADQQPGSSPPSFDKQFVRDYLETLDWDKTPPARCCHRTLSTERRRSTVRRRRG